MFGEIRTLGRYLRQLAETTATGVVGARAAFLHDNEAGWALKSGLKPINDPTYADTTRAIHRKLFDRAVTVDVLPPWADFTRYDLVVVPGLFLISDEAAQAVADYAHRGGTVLITWFSGIVDPVNTVRIGGYPGAFRHLIGAWSDEFFPLAAGEQLTLDNGWTAHRWSERMQVVDADVVARYAPGDTVGHPAITRRTLRAEADPDEGAPAGAGTVWYLSSDLDDPSLDALIDRLFTDARVEPVASVTPGIDAVRRADSTSSYLFLINNATTEGSARTSGVDLLTGNRHDGEIRLAAGAVAVIREDRD